MAKTLFHVYDPCPECSERLKYVAINPPEETEGGIAVGQLFCTKCDWCLDDLENDDGDQEGNQS